MAEPRPNDAPLMSDAEFRMFSELVREHCGLHFGPESRFLLEQRVARRVRDLEIGSFASYHYRLRSDSSADPELPKLVDDLTTNETYFMRELAQLKALVHEVIPEALAARRAQGGGPVAIWCAGCASGEEPYSIVMLAIEAGLVPGRDFRIYASDISRPALQKARRAVYREASFRDMAPDQRERWFEAKDGSWKLSDSVKRHVDFLHLNLLDRSRVALLGQLDVVICRNVMIYFDLDVKRRVVGTFAEKLRTGGHLLVGRSESLLHVSTQFELRHLRHDMVYRIAAPIQERQP
ncbi:MAG TPA: CheR family methyltransferase [Myxococcota bacterium]|nr:CheR family methyltransferase [Myxococcota bacterium]